MHRVKFTHGPHLSSLSHQVTNALFEGGFEHEHLLWWLPAADWGGDAALLFVFYPLLLGISRIAWLLDICITTGRYSIHAHAVMRTAITVQMTLGCRGAVEDNF